MSFTMSNVCALSELDLFARPPVQTSISSSRWVEYTPKLNYDKGNTPIEVEVTGTKGEYIDLSNIFYYMRASIRKNGVLLTDTDETGPINYLQSTMFKSLEVALNKKTVSVPGEYAYRSYIEALLNFGRDAKAGHLETSLWAKDNYNAMDSVLLTTDALKEEEIIKKTAKNDKRSVDNRFFNSKTVNGGLVNRRSEFIGKTCEMYGRLHSDIFNIEKLLIDDVNLDIKLVKNSDSFCLMGASGCSIQIDEFVLNVRKVKISEQVLLAHAIALEKRNAYYPMTRVDVQGRTISQGVISDKFENLIKGPLPRKIVLGMVSSSAFSGSLTKNPFNFQNFKVKEINVSVDGEQIPYQPFIFKSTDPSNPICARGYYSLFSENVNSMQYGNDIRMYEYQNGFQLLMLDLAQDGCVDHSSPEKTGNLRVKFSFDEGLKESITVIMYMEYESHFEINKIRAVDYQYIS